MTSDAIRLAELVAARLCHDLSGSLGTLMTATELASGSADAEEGAGLSGGSEAQALAAEAAAALGAQLRLLRAAWGADGGPLDAAGLAELASGLSVPRRVRIDLSELAPGVRFAPGAARIAANLLLLGVEALAGAGILAMSGSPASDVLITIEGPQAAWPAGMAAWLVDEQAAWAALSSARTLQGPLTALLARRLDVNLSLLVATGAVTGPAPLLLGRRRAGRSAAGLD